MHSPSVIVIDARNVERETQCSQALRVPAPLRERQGGREEQLRQTRQLHLCYKRCRDSFPKAQIDIFIDRNHYMDAHDDCELAAIRETDPDAFQKVPSGADVDRMLLAHALDVTGKSVVVISNDKFRDHIKSGFVSASWVEQHVWNFMFVRGELVVPSLASARSIDEEKPWTLWHERADNTGNQTSLRQDPSTASPPLQGTIVQSFEEVTVLRMQSQVASTDVMTWARIRCASGEGWIQCSHLHDSNIVFHQRVDNCAMPTALRKEPCLLSQPLLDLVVQPLAPVRVVSTEIEVNSASAEQILWVKIHHPEADGWLKRANLSIDPPSDTPDAKRQKVDVPMEVKKFHLRNLGYGESADQHIKDLKAVLLAHSMELKWHSTPGERRCEEPKSEEKQEPPSSQTSDCRASGDMGPPRPPPLSRWFLRELSIVGSSLSLERLTSKLIILTVDGIVMEFKPPFEQGASRKGSKSRPAYTARPNSAFQQKSSADISCEHFQPSAAASQVARPQRSQNDVQMNASQIVAPSQCRPSIVLSSQSRPSSARSSVLSSQCRPSIVLSSQPSSLGSSRHAIRQGLPSQDDVRCPKVPCSQAAW